MKPFLLVLLFLVTILTIATPSSALQPGDPAPPFFLRTSDGSPFFLSDQVGPSKKGDAKGLVLNFFAPHCKPCWHELPILNSLAEEFKKKGIRIVIIGYREDFDRILEMLEELKVDQPIILSDPYGKVGGKYQVRFLPTTVLIGSDGRIKEIIRGELPGFRETLWQKVNALR
jgi:thiol-disulfide isomerase/thioredoxin